MAAIVNRQILLKSRPEGAPSSGNFELTQGPIPEAGEGEVLMRIIYLSLDPYMRGRMSAAKSYATPAEIGQPMVGGTVGEIIQSRNPKFLVGDIVVGHSGWQEYGLSNGAGLRKLDPKAAPVSTALGVLGMPGMTAYVGLLEIGQPKPGETVVVAAASGAVGSTVGQIAKIKECRAVGIAGGTEKCLSLSNLHFHTLPLRQGGQSATLKGCRVDEHILPTAILTDEAKSPFRVIHFDGADAFCGRPDRCLPLRSGTRASASCCARDPS